MSLSNDYATIRILFFASARELAGEKESSVEVPRIIKGDDLLNFIIEKYGLKQLKYNVTLALNESWVNLSSVLTLEDADEVAVIPPLSGGYNNMILIATTIVNQSYPARRQIPKQHQTITTALYRQLVSRLNEVDHDPSLKMNSVKLTTDKLCVESVYKIVCSPEYGAVSLFVGTTRDNFEGKAVSKLEYEAYEAMAIKSLENICENIRKKFDVGNIAIFHRLGDVPIQEASVIIAISSAHRKPALSAVSYAIDALKANVPIWKKEVYEDGKSSEWKENSESKDVTSSVNSEFVQLYEEVVEADSANEVPAHLIQINANLQEIDRRINSFINMKREQINVSNVQDFCLEKLGNADESTCARVSAVLMRRKDSKSHLKVHRVENCVGPQTHGFESGSHSTARDSPVAVHNCPPGAEERLTNAENYLNVNRTSRDVFSRLKAIEDKILYLESISPEYFDFDREEKPKRKYANFKKTYTSLELDLKMQRLEEKLQKKSNT